MRLIIERRYEPDEERQAAAVACLLRRAETRGGGLETEPARPAAHGTDEGGHAPLISACVNETPSKQVSRL